MDTPTTAVRLEFSEVARIPMAGDNTAIAARRIEPGTRIRRGAEEWIAGAVILEGHRFAVARIGKGERLLSWGLPFGLALREIAPGEYVFNEKILKAFRERRVPFALPEAPNFADYRLPARLDEAAFRPGEQAPRIEDGRSFQGFSREGGRGVGTRNYIVLLGTISRTAGFVRALADRFREAAREFPNVDGVVAAAHTEGGGSRPQNNQEPLLRTLAGWAAHPNAGAVLCADFGGEPLNNTHLMGALGEQRRLDGLLHECLSIRGGFEEALREGERIVKEWLPVVNRFCRTEQPASSLKLALQCGGSDAFSGVSANPLLGILSREIAARGGSANLAETSELIGAESYILANARDFATARKFLAMGDRFQEWAAWHGHSAEGNPSGGNMHRGLYNISIKSIGAARKKDPATRLDYVIDYAEAMREPGFYFMDSPGNDLESIAGQVAAGCNMILFATGNGSITNFPFVPTIKVMTTTGRFELVRNEMDFNAGRYQDGEDLEALGAEAFELMLRAASGERTKGELAGHSQAQIWREWRRTGAAAAPAVKTSARPSGKAASVPLSAGLKAALSAGAAPRTAGLILPTSLCSGQIALMIAGQINREIAGRADYGIERAVALPHTEGCGNSQGEAEWMFMRTLANYLAHPFVKKALLLEHGCEKTHNDAFRNVLAELGIPEEGLGWASIQLDGGIEKVSAKARDWFARGAERPRAAGPLIVGFAGRDVPEPISASLRNVFQTVVDLGGSVIIAEGSGVASGERLEHGARPAGAGLHEMESPTEDLVEMAAGLGAAGASLLLIYPDGAVVPGHPLIPVVQIGAAGFDKDIDLALDPGANAIENARAVLEFIAEVLGGKRVPRATQLRNEAFQITRGETGISL